MDSDPVILSRGAAQQLQEVLRLSKNQPANQQRPFGDSSGFTAPQATWIRVTSLTTTSNRYPGIVQDYDESSQTFSDRTGANCWITPPNGETFGLKKYPAFASGANPSDGLPTYLGITTACDSTCVTDVSCVNSVLTVVKCG